MSEVSYNSIMQVELRIIRNYVTKNGVEPFGLWVNSLKNKKVQAIVFERLNRIRLGNFGDCHHLGQGLQELRIHFGSGYRLYFGEAGKTIIVLLCAGDKRSQRADIKKAKEYWQEFKNRNL